MEQRSFNQIQVVSGLQSRTKQPNIQVFERKPKEPKEVVTNIASAAG
jgi:hypothetical protein